ncbi:HlyD family secretion protein [Shimia gijangensis]|uniref:Membrane fusion protein (MFP) family protein n=1 Tax=Shimia gijangensis TaxID=1470563 RepID=A0A1M6BQ54_9RHOB|nr:HlyD family type I secretion periplasmic adaptor subunit [Shimia gijangensis]SHI50857.1 HlyD family secretion protein [Shimia gijangensis]
MSNANSKWSARRPLAVGMLTLAVLVIGFGSWASLSKISGAIIAGGQIEVDRNRQVVQHLDGGVVEKIMVDEGDTVKAGQVLIQLDSKLLASNMATTEGQLYELMARRGRFEAERDDADQITFDPELLEVAEIRQSVANSMAGQNRLFQARITSLGNEISQMHKRRTQISDQIRGIEAQQESLTTQLELIISELEDQKSLYDRGLAPASRVLALQREEASLLGEVGELTAGKAQAQGRITELEIKIIKLHSQRREDAITRLRDLQYNEIELREKRRSLAEKLSRLDISSPVSGVVYGLQVFAPRSVIRPAEPVLFVVPQDRPLIIAAQVAIIHIDQIYTGQEVSLRFSALDQRNTPELFGEVINVSPDAFQDDNTGASYYRAEIVLSPGEIDNLPEDVTLIPGMPVEAYLRTSDRTPLAYLVKPLTDFFIKAFREG